MSILRTLSFVLPLLAVCCAASTVHADDPKVRLQITAPRRARLLERRRDEDVWTVLCEGGCVVDAIPDPLAEHRFEIEHEGFPFHVDRSLPLQRFVFHRPSRVSVVGIVAASVGGFSVLAGGCALALGAFQRSSACPESGRDACDRTTQRRDDDERRTTETGTAMVAIGAVVTIVGIVMMLAHVEERPSVSEEPPRAGVRLHFLPTFAGTEGSAPIRRSDGWDARTMQLPLVGATF